MQTLRASRDARTAGWYHHVSSQHRAYHGGDVGSQTPVGHRQPAIAVLQRGSRGCSQRAPPRGWRTPKEHRVRKARKRPHPPKQTCTAMSVPRIAQHTRGQIPSLDPVLLINDALLLLVIGVSGSSQLVASWPVSVPGMAIWDQQVTGPPGMHIHFHEETIAQLRSGQPWRRHAPCQDRTLHCTARAVAGSGSDRCQSFCDSISLTFLMRTTEHLQLTSQWAHFKAGPNWWSQVDSFEPRNR